MLVRSATRVRALNNFQGNTPHNPVRFENTIGLVMERKRPEGLLDHMQWYCKKGNHETPTLIRQESFYCFDLGIQLKPLIRKWQEDENLRQCPHCGQVEDPM